MPVKPTLPRPDILIFDVDGTLIDVSNSYRATVPVAIARYLALLGLSAPALDGAIYDRFKLMGGFNDDWDLVAGFLSAVLAPLPSAAPLTNGRPVTDPTDLLAAIRSAAAPLAGLTPTLPDWEVLIPAVRAAGGGLAGLRQVVGTHNSHLVWHTGDLATDLVQRLFSELYLGGQLFTESYGVPACFHNGPGAVETERLLIDPATLEMLHRRARLGIATGRNDQELQPARRRWALDRFFTAIATVTDAQAARRPGGPSLLKPHPFLLERAADGLDPTRRLVAAYIGDMPDDIVAARRADGERCWLAIGIAATAERAAHQRELGADLVLQHPDELVNWWKDCEPKWFSR